jgi:hypothetical protein
LTSDDLRKGDHINFVHITCFAKQVYRVNRWVMDVEGFLLPGVV